MNTTSTTTTTTNPTPAAARTCGPQQAADRLGIEPWRLDRALDLGLIPPAGPAGRWPADVLDTLAARTDEIRAATGTLPDLGAVRAADHLTPRLGTPVDPDTVTELARTGAIRRAGTYKGHPLYNGLGIERFTDRAALDRARQNGRLLHRHAAARHLGIRDCDLNHLVRAGLLRPAAHVHSRYQPRSWAPEVALYRAGDLNTLLTDPALDWPDPRHPQGPPLPPRPPSARRPYAARMTSTPARRTLGAGPTEPISAAEADLRALPHIDFPDPADLRARGVLAPPSAPAPRARRTLGNGGRSDTGTQ